VTKRLVTDAEAAQMRKLHFDGTTVNALLDTREELIAALGRLLDVLPYPEIETTDANHVRTILAQVRGESD
jgi:hypothetical protein